jgi:antitoxin (DNA-binding transcriptional repressor) of toxin-antitoxin stability system
MPININQMSTVVHRLPITKARVNLGELVRRVNRNKEYFILEKDGIAVAGIMGAGELEDYLELRDPKVREHIRKSNIDYMAGRSRAAKDFLAELRVEAAMRKPVKKRPPSK